MTISFKDYYKIDSGNPMTRAVRYRTNSSQVDAIQFFGNKNCDEVMQWLCDSTVVFQLIEDIDPCHRTIRVVSDRYISVRWGEWLIRDEQDNYFVADSYLFSQFFVEV
jgi:hypothetical protein